MFTANVKTGKKETHEPGVLSSFVGRVLLPMKQLIPTTALP